MNRIAMTMTLAAGALMAAAPAFPQNENEGHGQAVVTVLPANDKAPAGSVSPQDMVIKVNGKDTRITNLQPLRGQNDRLELVVLIDSSARSSIGTQLNEIGNFVKTLPAQAKVSIAWMANGTAQLATPLTTDHQAALKGIHLPSGVPGQSASPYFCLSNLAQHWPSGDRSARRVVVMITDGIDYYNPRYDPNDPYMQAAVTDSVKSGLVVYSIYWQNQGRFDRSAYGTDAGQNLLNQVTQTTGGYSYWQGYGNPVSFAPYFKDLDRRLENQYEVAFTAPLKGKSGDVANLKVKVNNVPAKVDAPQQVYVARTTAGM
ncbi:MAG TPA: hypothetical protein VGL00_06395 [Terracidiphilus sp.]